MGEYIEKEKTIEWARLTYCKDCNSYNGIRCRACEFYDIISLIECYPAADVVEVVHGEWIRHKENCLYNKCSICSYEHCREDNYCPNCGADMRGTNSDT